MLWIGITGPMGGGKSTVSEILRQGGFVVLDADQIVHKILGPGGRAEQEVLQTFGQGLRNPQGFIDRRALGQRVFVDPEKLAQLERILHPIVRQEVALEREALERRGVAAAFYDVPLLFEKGMEGQFDKVIVVTASEDKRRERVKLRSRLTDEEFNARAARQMPATEKESRADILIRNDGDRAQLQQEVAKCLTSLGLTPG